MSAVYFTPSIAIALFFMFFVLPIVLRNKNLTETPELAFTQGSAARFALSQSQPDSVRAVNITRMTLAQASQQVNNDHLAATNMNQDLGVHSGKIFSVNIMDKEQAENNMMDDQSITSNTTYYVVIDDTTDSFKAEQAYTI